MKVPFSFVAGKTRKVRKTLERERETNKKTEVTPDFICEAKLLQSLSVDAGCE